MSDDSMIYIIYGFNAYYPPADGTIEAHPTREAAEAVADTLNEWRDWRTSGDEMLPERLRGSVETWDHYDVAEVVVIDE